MVAVTRSCSPSVCRCPRCPSGCARARRRFAVDRAGHVHAAVDVVPAAIPAPPPARSGGDGKIGPEP